MSSGAAKRRVMLVICLAGVLLFGALGVWQVKRLAWKRDLIARVEARIHAPAVPVPARGEWTQLNPRDAEYRRVAAHGIYLHERETLVDALTVLGAGFWVMTPLETGDGTILVNRGFMPAGHRATRSSAGDQTAGPVNVVGLLRNSEPTGRMLRTNDPAADRWFSRDVMAIAATRGLEDVAPFFIDAEDAGLPGAWPRGGMTVVHFRNAHLAYAATWFALAALCITGTVLLRRPVAPE